MLIEKHVMSFGLALGIMCIGAAARGADRSGEMADPNTCYLSSLDTAGTLACFDEQRQPLQPTLVGVDFEASTPGINFLNLQIAIKGAGSPGTAYGEYDLRINDEIINDRSLTIVLYPMDPDSQLVTHIARAGRGGGRAVYRGAGSVHRSGAVYRGGAIVRGGAVATRGAYYGGAACGYYPYPPCGSAYYGGGGAAYRGGAVYRGGGAVYRRGGAIHRGGGRAHVSHRGGGGRRR